MNQCLLDARPCRTQELLASPLAEAIQLFSRDFLYVEPEYTLQNPRAAAQMVRVGSKVWMIGGRSYVNHFPFWGEYGFAPYSQLPNPEYFDLDGGGSTYTSIETGKDFFNATAFTLADDSTDIYLSCNNLLAKIDTVEEKLVTLGTTSLDGARVRGSAVRLVIKGKRYIAVFCDCAIHYFDPDRLDFVLLPDVLGELPVGSYGVESYENKVYLFGGNADCDYIGSQKAWVFDPNAPLEGQLKELPSLPVPLGNPKCVRVGTVIYLFGGTSRGDLSPLVFSYDLRSGQYARKGNLPAPLYYHNALAMDDGSVLLQCGYSMGAGKTAGFREHKPFILRYRPQMDTRVRTLTKRMESATIRMNVVLSFSDADAIMGPCQSRSVNWQAPVQAGGGMLYFRKYGDTEFTQAPAGSSKYDAGIYTARSCTAEMTGLAPDTIYEYYVETFCEPVQRSQIFLFKTYPASAERIRTVIFGDSKSGYEICNEIAYYALKDLLHWEKEGIPAFTIELGDFGAYGSYDEYGAWINSYTSKEHIGTRNLVSRFPFIAVHGNHENLRDTYFHLIQMPEKAMSGWPALQNTGYPQRWFSYNFGPVHFIELTLGRYTDQEWYSQTQRQWFEVDLAYAKKLKDQGNLSWIVVITHQSFMTTGEHFSDIGDCGQFYCDKGLSYMDLIERYGDGVDVVYSSHDHNYERSHAISGFRWIPNKGDGKPGYKRLPDASVYQAPPFTEIPSGKGVVYIVTGGAGAGQRTMYPSSVIGDASWISTRKTNPDAGECVEQCPVYNYLTLEADKEKLILTAIEKDLSYLPGIIDDETDGVIDQLVIKKIVG